MNRPNSDNYWDRGGFKLSDYNDVLEEYCDELEKALDKACDVLADEIRACCKPTTYLSKECDECKKCWKEYLLNDKR